MITTKEYKCEKCGKTKNIETNHDGSFRGCSFCRDKRAYLVYQTEKGILLHNTLQAEKKALRDTLPKSILSEKQEKFFSKNIGEFGKIVVKIRWDDSCHNNHNTFAITGDLKTEEIEVCGCIHEEIVKYFPEFEYLLNWHHFTSDGYDYRGSNIIFHMENGDIALARKCANWGDATPEQLLDRDVLMERLPRLMEQLKRDVENLGFTY